MAVLLALVAVALSPATMAWLRSDYAWIGRPLLWLDSASTSELDLTHVALFGGITWLLACLWPRLAWWRLLLFMLALAVVTEVVQRWVPGRTPRLTDVVDDLLGAGVGLALSLPLRWLARRRAGR
jgi:hypothetical protein